MGSKASTSSGTAQAITTLTIAHAIDDLFEPDRSPTASIEMMVDSWSRWNEVFRMRLPLAFNTVKLKQVSGQHLQHVENQWVGVGMAMECVDLEDIPTGRALAVL